MQISRRMEKISPSLTLAFNARAQEMRAQGIDVLNLAAGEPDFPTPEFIKDAAKEAMDQNFTRYTSVAGIPELRKAAGDYFLRHYATEVPPESIIIGAGGKQCLYSFIQATINPGDEVLIPSPCWVSYPDMVLLAEGVPVKVAADATQNFKVTPMMLENATTDKTRMLILNSPCNPTGAVYTDREFMQILRWALARNIFVLSDEIYDQIVFPPAVATSAITWFAHCPELVAVVNGLSKSYAMTGWRVGFTAAHTDLIKKIAILQGHSLSNVCSIAQKAALAALTGPQECVAKMKVAFERRRDLAMKIIGTWSKAICPKPDGAFYLFVDLSGYYNAEINTSMQMCIHILENAHVAGVPGIAFGDDNCVRFSYATSDEILEKALLAVGKSLNVFA